MIEKIFALWLYVNDLEQSRYFYETILGLKFKFQDGDWIEFDLGNITFAILKRPSSKGQTPPQKTHIMFQTQNIADCKKHLLTNGVLLDGEVRNEPYGKLLTFIDPNGHRLELFESSAPGCGCGKTLKN